VYTFKSVSAARGRIGRFGVVEFRLRLSRHLPCLRAVWPRERCVQGDRTLLTFVVASRALIALAAEDKTGDADKDGPHFKASRARGRVRGTGEKADEGR